MKYYSINKNIIVWGAFLSAIGMLVLSISYFIIRELFRTFSMFDKSNNASIAAYLITIIIYFICLIFLSRIAVKKMSMVIVGSGGVKFILFVLVLICILTLVAGSVLTMVVLLLNFAVGEQFVDATEIGHLLIGLLGSVLLVLNAIGQSRRKS